mmetsp:Transcript_11390/g.25000  ORF Transcript_11390/g.25000 Transcript_11390/m.25000 type:complete len:398 (-) Transcript_11390:139-1332(-)
MSKIYNLGFLPHILQQQSTTSQSPSSIPKLGEELDIVQVTRNIIGTLVKRKVLSIILRHKHGIGPANGPHLIFISPRHIRNTISTRLNIGFSKGELLTVQIGTRGTGQQLSTIKRHPHSILNISPHESHVLNSSGRAAVMRDPKVLTRLPRQEEVTTGRYREVGTLRITLFVIDTSCKVRRAANSRGGDTVERGINRFLDLRLPIPTGIVGSVHRSGGGDHLGLIGTQGENSRGFTGKLWGEWDALPALSAVFGVEEQGGLSEDPSLAILETHRFESVGDLLLGIEVGERAGFPCEAAVVRFGEGSAGTDDVTVGFGVEGDVVHGVFEGDLDLDPFLFGRGRGGEGEGGGGGEGGEGDSGGGGGGFGDEGTTVFRVGIRCHGKGGSCREVAAAGCKG